MPLTLKQEWEIFWDSGCKDIISETEFNCRSHQGEITIEILKKRKPYEKILEAGCGLGNWVFLFEKLRFESYGLDISYSSLNKAARYSENNSLKAKFLQADMRKLPFRDSVFDVIVSYGVIEHFSDSDKALKELFRILKPEGTCLITTPNPFSFHRLMGRHLLNITKSRKLGYIGFEKAFTPKELAVMLREAGFSSVNYGILSNGMGYLFGEFWPAIPLIGKYIFATLLKLAHFIETRQRTIGGGSFAIGNKL